MTVTLPSQKNVRDVKTLHLVADARISTCAVLSGKKTPSRNVRIYLRSAMYNVSAAVAAVHRLCNEHCTQEAAASCKHQGRWWLPARCY